MKTNIPFLLNVLQNETFLSGQFATDFIDSTPSLFDLETGSDDMTKLLTYLGEVAVNGANHPERRRPRAHRRGGYPAQDLRG